MMAHDDEGNLAGADAKFLVARARSGDAASFRALYDAHIGRVHALSLRLMADRAEAEELTQDVFVTAWRQLGAYRGDARFATWLHGITVRLSRQRLRGLLRRRARAERYGHEFTGAVNAPMPSADHELERALAELPLRMRTALVLYAVEGYTQAETAALMGIAEGTVKAHVHRARTLLQERMDRNG